MTRRAVMCKLTDSRGVVVGEFGMNQVVKVDVDESGRTLLTIRANPELERSPVNPEWTFAANFNDVQVECVEFGAELDHAPKNSGA